VKNYLRRNGAWIGFLALAVIITIATDGGFLSARNLSNLVRQASINGLLAGGMTLIILTGGIDLSVGSVVALCGILAGLTQVNHGWAGLGAVGAWGSLAVAVLAGTLIGALNGTLIAVLRLAPFVITLGMMVMARGFALILSDGAAIAPVGESLGSLANANLPMPWTVAFTTVVLMTLIWRGLRIGKAERGDLVFPFATLALLSYAFITYRGIPVLSLFLMAVLGVLGFVLARTTFGRSVYALGSNERAAYWAGVPLKKVTILVYIIMGALAGLGGLLLTARLNGADPNAGQLFELDAIAAVVIGGTSLKGGQGSIMGSFIGALMIATLNNGMDLLGVSSFYQMVFKGLIIVVAVSLDHGQRRG